MRGGHNFKDLAGQTFGRLFVVQRSIVNKRGRVWWHVICDCGVEQTVTGSNLSSGITRSCGCLSREITAEMGRRQGQLLKGAYSPAWKGSGCISGKSWSQLKRDARRRGLEFLLTIEEAWRRFEAQRGRCALSGTKLSFSDAPGGSSGGGRLISGRTASLDRIDSTKGYVLSNVQWVHKDINRMKMDLPEERFVELCRQVAHHAEAKTRG